MFVLRFISFIRIISFICIFTGLLCEEKTHENKFDMLKKDFNR